MSFLDAGLLGLLGLSVPLIALYLLKMRRVDRVVPSTLLWQKALQDVQAATPFQKLRRNLLLLLQLVALALAVGAIAKPVVVRAATEGRSIAVVLDLSASMKARESGVRRFETARRHAEDLVAGLAAASEPGEMMIVAAGARTRVAANFTSDEGALRRALSDLRPSDGRADLGEALALASAALKSRARPEIYLISDGAGARLQNVPDLPNLHFVGVGEGSENLAITHLDVRTASPKRLAEMKAAGELADGRYPFEIFATVRNFSAREVTTTVSLAHEERLAAAREVTIAAGGEAGIVYKERLAPGLARVSIDATDALDVDNSAWAILRPSDEVRVGLYTPGNPFLVQALATLPYIAVVEVTDPKSGGWDLLICDRQTPDALPDTNVLLIAPTRDLEGFVREGKVDYPEITDWATEHPLLRSVEFADVHIAEAQGVRGVPRGQVLVRGTGGAPLLVLSREPSLAFRAILTFAIQDSDWPLRPSFPIFVTNLVQYARDATFFGTAPFHKTGAVVTIPSFGTALTVATPDEESFPFGATESPHHLFGETERAGVYTVTWGRERALRFCVNLLDENESNLTPAKELQVGSRTVAAASSVRDVNRDLWPWLVGVIFAVALFEWFAFHRKWGT